ncbi:MAG: site-specific integrase [Pirellulaceae bacterium]
MFESFEGYLQGECRLSPHTVEAYCDLRRFHQWLGSRAVSALTIADLSDYAAWLDTSGLAPPRWLGTSSPCECSFATQIEG